jgi:hypothetical protein
MKKIFTLLSIVAITGTTQAQAVMIYDFQTVKKGTFKDYDGMLDSLFANPVVAGSNTSAVCGRYIRKAIQYDNLKLYAKTKYSDVTPYAAANAPTKMSMLVMSKMPVGSKIDIQLGTRTDQSYPGGVHTIYTGTTTVMNQWEKIMFPHTSTPLNGFSLPGSIDKMVILFNTNALTADTIYFDEIMGPDVEPPTAIQEIKNTSFSVSQNIPNPAKDNTSINLSLTASGHVSMVIYDVLGKAVSTPVNGDLDAGTHTFSIETDNMPNGIYFYTVKKGAVIETRKMVVAN